MGDGDDVGVDFGLAPGLDLVGDEGLVRAVGWPPVGVRAPPGGLGDPTPTVGDGTDATNPAVADGGGVAMVLTARPVVTYVIATPPKRTTAQTAANCSAIANRFGVSFTMPPYLAQRPQGHNLRGFPSGRRPP